MINFALPGMYKHNQLCLSFVHLFKNHPEFFRPDVNISAVYGNFQYCIWEGGRIFKNYTHATKEQIEKAVHAYNYELQTPMRFIFTNTELTEEDCYDRFCNMVLSVCDNGMNEIVVNSPILEKYIRDTFPNYKIISSTTKCLSNKNEQVKELNNDYSLVCLDYGHNRDLEYLKSLSEEEKEKSELLVNAVCKSNCPNRKVHYKLNSEYILNMGKQYQLRQCLIEGSNLKPEYIDYSNNIQPDEIENIYAPMGFSHFKIEGRTYTTIELLCQYVKYLIKPEYQLYIVSRMISAIKTISPDNLNNFQMHV